MNSRPFGLCVLLLCLIATVLSDEYSHKYVDGEEILLWVNKVGPYRNPQETYKYYTLPYCKPEKDVESRFEGLGEALQGYELIQSDMKMYYKRDIPETTLCEPSLSAEDVEKFKVAVKNQYWYQLFMDDLPIWGMVGEAVPDGGEEKLYLYTHKKFMATWNEDRVIEVNLTSENPIPLERGATVTFTYSISWHKTNTPYSQRFEKYLDENFFEHQIHWFSIFNSFMMVIFLTGLVSMILMRTLRRDYARYAKDEEDGDDDPRDIDESGWKQVHGDVFRPPPHLVTFAALIGTGHQLIVLVFVVVVYSFLMGSLYAHRGTTVTAFIVCYVFTSFVGGYGGGGFYARNDGKHWIKAMILTATLFPGTCFGIALLLDFIAVMYGSLASIPIGTIFIMLIIWIFASIPLTIAGTLVGRNWNGTADNPCRINPVPRQIPEKKWYMHPFVNIVLGGILPFGSIFIEMYFMFTAFWHYKYYYVYGFMLLVYVILIVVSICVTIVSTYFLLNSEDYRWQWVSFLSSASTAGYVFLYSIYYFFVKTKMSGFFQTCFYFGYTGMFCVGLGILCGALGYIGTSVFVKKIYQNVKVD